MPVSAQTLTPRAAALLLVPPLLWASNAIVGRMIHEMIPPMTLNFVRWVMAGLLLLPFTYQVLRRHSPLWSHWKRYAMLSLLGVGCYNSLQYLALQTSTPINVTLVASSNPVFMLGIGALFFKQAIRKRQIVGAVLSIFGVLLVLSRGDLQSLLQVQLVVGDVFVLLATASWAGYSWLLSHTTEPTEVRHDWANFLMAQIALGLVFRTVYRWGVGHHRCPHSLELALGRCAGLCVDRARDSGLPLLGFGGATRRAQHCWFFCQPHALVCGPAVCLDLG